MVGDIKNYARVLTYPKVESFDSITGEEIVKYIDNNQQFFNKYKNNQQYYIGHNVSINKKRNVSKDNPDSRVNAPYSRTMVQIVKGYMYKPGLITYHSENEAYLNVLTSIFKENLEELKTSEIGENQSKYGIGVELMYMSEKTSNIQDIKALPRFTSISPEECVFLYNMDIEPSLIGTIRYYIINEDQQTQEKTYRVEVYFMDRVEVYEMKESLTKKTVSQIIETYPNFFGEIPFNIYINNNEYMADYESVGTLVDSYDTLMSDSVNELNRFASAYLLLYNYIIANVEDETEKAAKLEQIKSKRVFEFLTDGAAKTGAEFLTKDIPTDFMDSLRSTLREDIEYHSHIPDFRSKTFEAKSGIAMQYSLVDFENLCGDKQSWFEVGLQRRIKLINNILKLKATEVGEVDIKFTRNVPADDAITIAAFAQLAATGKVPDEILLGMLPSDIVPDVQEAIEKLKVQKEENMAMMDIDMQGDNTNNEEE